MFLFLIIALFPHGAALPPLLETREGGSFFVLVCTHVHLASSDSRGGLIIIYYYIDRSLVVFFVH